MDSSPCAKVLFYNIAKHANVGPIIRSCAAFGVSECVFSTLSHRDAHAKFGSQGTHKKVLSSFHPSLASAVSQLRNDGFQIVGVEITDDAKPLDTNPFPSKTCFLFGNEGDGLNEHAMKVCDSFIYIRQYGQKTASLNVSVAAGIVLHQWAQWAQLKEAHRVGNKYVVTQPQPVLIGTYTTKQGHVDGKGQGVYRCNVSPHTGLLTDLELVVERTDPSWISLVDHQTSPTEAVLLCVVESGKSTDSLNACLIDRNTLKPVANHGEIVSSVPTGVAPCHLDVTQDGVVVSCYCGGLQWHPVSPNGLLTGEPHVFQPTLPPSGVDPVRQTVAHPHYFTALDDGKLGISVDLGCDALLLHHLPNLRPLQPSLTVPGGPRHFVVHPHSPMSGYVITELSNEVYFVEFHVKGDGVEWTLHRPVSSLPPTYVPDPAKRKPGASAIRVHPECDVLFVANRFHDSITSFIIQPNGELTFHQNVSCEGQTPRDINFSPDGELLLVANQDSSTLACFLFEDATRNIRFTGQRFPCPSPTCILFP